MFEINNIINYNNDHARIFFSNFSIINETKRKIQTKFNSNKKKLFLN
jgi:hypothetical protein